MEKLYTDIDILWRDLGRFELALSYLENTINSIEIESDGVNESFLTPLSDISSELDRQIDFLRDLLSGLESETDAD